MLSVISGKVPGDMRAVLFGPFFFDEERPNTNLYSALYCSETFFLFAY